MIKSLWQRFFLLLVAVALIALSAALLLRELMVSDFRQFMEGEMEDRAYWVTASFEGSFDRFSGWERQSLIENTTWALMMGFDLRLYDTDGKLVIDTESAIDTLSPLVKKRVTAISEQRAPAKNSEYHPYSLFFGGNEIGRLDLRFRYPKKEKVFILRSDKLLLLSLLVLGGIAIILSVIFSRMLTRPLKQLTEAVTAVGKGDLRRRVTPVGGDELGRLSEAFNRMAQALELHESLRKKLTSNIAHELRTPISVVRGELEGMMDGFISTDAEHLHSLYEEIGRLRRIIEALEELSQAEASALTLRKERFDLRSFLVHIVEMYKKIFEEKGVVLGISCKDGIFINADPDRLSQIVINLLTNSLRATDKGGEVEISASTVAGAVTMTVRDNGRGIREEDIPFIFERFYRVGNGGLGLGLTIVKELVTSHGGSISVTSEQGKGTTFTLSFPA